MRQAIVPGVVGVAGLVVASFLFRPAPPPADQSGNPNTNATRLRPYDHVLVSQCLLRSQLDAGLVFDSRVYMPLSDVPPVLFSDSAATNSSSGLYRRASPRNAGSEEPGRSGFPGAE